MRSKKKKKKIPLKFTSYFIPQAMSELLYIDWIFLRLLILTIFFRIITNIMISKKSSKLSLKSLIQKSQKIMRQKINEPFWKFKSKSKNVHLLINHELMVFHFNIAIKETKIHQNLRSDPLFWVHFPPWGLLTSVEGGINDPLAWPLCQCGGGHGA